MSTTITIRDATKALQAHFSAAKAPPSLPLDDRRMLQSFVDEHEGKLSEEESARASLALKDFWERHVGDDPAKNSVFIGVLRELRPAIVREADALEWWQRAVKPVLTGTAYRKAALDDAQEFLVGHMVGDGDEDDSREHARMSQRLRDDLLDIYIARSRGPAGEDPFTAPENAQVTHQVENVLVAFGRKRPKDLFIGVAALITSANTRLQGLTLLSSFLRHQMPHLYLVDQTPLVEYLLKCLMNDLSTTVLSVALTSLIMLLPHIPGSLGPLLPRMFLVYSRLLCWERFSPLSTDAQRNLVTDDRVPTDPDVDHGDVGIDPSWEKARPKDGAVEAVTPELMTYFTYLYGLYPLNFMSYIRKPRRYLKSADFPGADDFDLDRTVIRTRTEQFRQVHLLHPNFFHMTIEEEMSDPKWPKMEPADVVAECHGLCINARAALVPPGPPPTAKLPDVPPVPPLAFKGNMQVSPSNSHASLRSGHSWRDTQSTVVSVAAQMMEPDSPTLSPQCDDAASQMARSPPKANGGFCTSPSTDDFPRPGSRATLRSPPYLFKDKDEPPHTDVAYLQRENTVLKNELNFERWHKAQYSQHISQLMRKNVKDATAEAETLNLINANRALKQQLEQIRNAREATIKDSALTRKQANSLESSMTDRVNNMKKEQETWRADAEELQRLRKETEQYRELVTQSEAREMNQSHQLEIVKRDLERMHELQAQLQEAQRRLCQYEYREFEMNQATRELEIVRREKETLELRVQRYQHNTERTLRAYADKIAELEAQLARPDAPSPRQGSPPDYDTQALIQQAVADSQNKLNQMKRKHTALMERHTDLEMEYESMKEQLQVLMGGHNGQTFFRPASGDSMHTRERNIVDMYDVRSDHGSPMAPSESAYVASASDPTGRYYQPMNGSNWPTSPTRTDAAGQSPPSMRWAPPPALSQKGSAASSRGSGAHPFTYNKTEPLRTEEAHTPLPSSFSICSDESDQQKKKEKIQPESKVRVYGRGGAQNIKMKPKEKDGMEKPAKRGTLKNLRNLV